MWTPIPIADGRGSGAIASFDSKVLGDPGLEAICHDCDGVVAYRQQSEAVVARAIRLRRARFIGVEVFEGYAGVSNDRAGRVADSSKDIGRSKLRERLR